MQPMQKHCARGDSTLEPQASVLLFLVLAQLMNQTISNADMLYQRFCFSFSRLEQDFYALYQSINFGGVIHPPPLIRRDPTNPSLHLPPRPLVPPSLSTTPPLTPAPCPINSP
jgi:hypothetical protein